MSPPEKVWFFWYDFMQNLSSLSAHAERSEQFYGPERMEGSILGVHVFFNTESGGIKVHNFLLASVIVEEGVTCATSHIYIYICLFLPGIYLYISIQAYIYILVNRRRLCPGPSKLFRQNRRAYNGMNSI